MKVNLKDITYYYLTTGRAANRENHMKNEFKDYNLFRVVPVSNYNRKKYKSACSGNSLILDHASKNQDPNKPFQPFVILEDDAKMCRKIPDLIDIPDNCDLFYLGISGYTLNSSQGIGTVFNKPHFKNINSEIVQLYNMLSTHAIMICSVRGLVAYQKCISEAFFRNLPWDTVIAHSHPYLNVYAFKHPIFFQGGPGGVDVRFRHIQKDMTNVKIDQEKDNVIPDSKINKTNFTNLTFYKT
tara:strand:+ start:792 stop:1514 length:723 start_codon:yes stop_codon:yes gene_type:complete